MTKEMTAKQAEEVLKKHRFTPGVSKTKGLPELIRAEIKQACAVLKAAAGDAKAS